MDTQQIDILLQEADEMVRTAEAEMNRAEEDTITHAICFQSRQAIINYLTAFLLDNGVQRPDPATMASLLEACRRIDGRFDLINIDNILCRFDGQHKEYCLDVHHVGHCLKVARQTGGIVNGSTPGY